MRLIHFNLNFENISNVFIIASGWFDMKQVVKYFSVVAIIALFALVTISESMQEADATKAKGKFTKKYGENTKNKVCGDKLCGQGPSSVNVGRIK